MAILIVALVAAAEADVVEAEAAVSNPGGGGVKLVRFGEVGLV